MNSFARADQDAREFGCGGCAYEVESLGPVFGPEKPPDPRVKRWSMTPAEWAGQEMPDARF